MDVNDIPSLFPHAWLCPQAVLIPFWSSKLLAATALTLSKGWVPPPPAAVWDTERIHLSPDLQQTPVLRALNLSAEATGACSSSLLVSPLGFLSNFPLPQSCRGILWPREYSEDYDARSFCWDDLQASPSLWNLFKWKIFKPCLKNPRLTSHSLQPLP